MRRSLPLLLACLAFNSSGRALSQETNAGLSGQRWLDRALALADLYNWAEAAPLFQQAQSAFEQAGDARNALYARLGFIRASIERQQQTLPRVSHELGIELEDNPLLQTDKRLRLFALIVKGDIDAETDTAAMRDDWHAVQALARELGDAKWGYRSLAQIGVAAFYDGDIETARKSAGAALAAAAASGDMGAQIRILTVLGRGLVETKAYDQALPYLEKALALASSLPDAGYQFTTQEVRIGALIGLKQFDPAQQLVDEVLRAAERGNRPAHEATVLGIAAELALAMGDNSKALAALQLAIEKAEAIGLLRTLSKCYAMAAELQRRAGNFEKAEQHLADAARATQLSGDIWAAPQRLHMLAELYRAHGQYQQANDVYERAEAFVDAMIGKSSTVLEKAALIRSASEIYTRHFSLVADHFKDPDQAYSIVEQVRGRIAVDQLLAGTLPSDAARKTERAIAELRLKLMQSKSTAEVKRLRDEIFVVEQARWVSPGVSILKRHSSFPTKLNDVQRHLPGGTVLLEYVISEPSSYCLVITSNGARIVPIKGRDHVEKLASSFLTKVKARQSAGAEARRLYDVLVRPATVAGRARLVVVRDGPLHLVPFEAFVLPSGRYLAQTAVISYAPSATSFYLMNKDAPSRHSRRMLGVGGIGYARSSMNSAGIARSNERRRFAELPSSGEEIRAAANAVGSETTTLLSGKHATESAFKRSELGSFQFLHLAVHGFADRSNPDKAALVMLSDPHSGEDGFLYAPEIVQLKLSADLVVLSACETAVGPLQGQEGISNLSRAFLLAGSKSVVSTLWQADDAASALLMKRFYAHVARNRPPDQALADAKRDILRRYGARAVPYLWAGFIIEGVASTARSESRRISNDVAQSRDSQADPLQH